MSSYTMFEENFWSENGFDELRRLMKQGSDFIKEAMSILQERSDIEKQYANKLQQLTKKARRANSFCIGSISEAWQKFGDNIETESEIHKTLAGDLMNECYNPLKLFLDEKLRQRKPLEGAVEKQKKTHQDKSNEQLKLKKTAHLRCRELEQCLDQLESLKSRKGATNDKDINKIEKNVRTSEEKFGKADRDYKDSNIKTEECRLSWESSMYRCCRHLEELEHIRTEEVSRVIKKYTELMLTIIAPIQETNEELSEATNLISVDRDIELMCQTNGTGPNVPEQLLLDTFEEELNNHMNLDRRQAYLDRKIQDFEADIDRKQKEKRGVLSLSAAYEKTPDFVDEQGAADVNRQVIEANAMLNLLKANHFKLLSSRSEISHLPLPESPFKDYMTKRKDRQNMTMTTLSIPIDQISVIEEQTKDMASWSPPTYNEDDHHYTTIDKSSPPAAAYDNQASYDDGKFTVTNENYYLLKEFQVENQEQADNDYHYISRCEAIYDYEGQQSDELTILPGDTIYVTEKIDTDWWQGNLNGTIGIFPANYVEEIEVYD